MMLFSFVQRLVSVWTQTSRMGAALGCTPQRAGGQTMIRST